jgi:hypothetical protein
MEHVIVFQVHSSKQTKSMAFQVTDLRLLKFKGWRGRRGYGGVEGFSDVAYAVIFQKMH